MSGAAADLVPWLVDAALKATAVLGLALVADTALRRSPAASRHMVWTVAVAGVLAIPLASSAVPSVEADLWPGLSSTAASDAVRSVAEQRTEALEREAVMIRAFPPVETTDPGRASDIVPSPMLSSESGPWEVASLDGEILDGWEGRVEGPVQHDGASSGLTLPAADGSEGGWTWLAGVFWLLGVLVVLATLAGERLLLVFTARRGETFGRGRVQDRARELARDMGLSRLPRLLRLEEYAMPATWGVIRQTVALPAAAEQWSDGRLESVLAHEMAHVRRRDCAIQTVAVLACALYWFHPLVWVAAARLRRERELAADDEVLALGTRPSSYARELLTLAASTRRHALAVTATAMATERGLPRRIRSVVSGDRRRGRISRGLVFRAVGIGALVVLPLAALAPGGPESEGSPGPGGVDLRRSAGLQEQEVVRVEDASPARSRSPVSGPEECWRPDVSHSMRIHSTENRHELEWKSDGCESEILVDGEVRFSADFEAVQRISDGGSLRVEEETDEYRRSVEYRTGSAGSVRRTFRRDGDVADPTAREERWIRERLTTVLRQTGIAAGERVAWILERSGPDGVLEELEWITADGPAGRYMTELLDRAGLNEGQLRRFLELGAERIGSDGVLTSVLVRTVEEYPGPVAGSVSDAFRRAAGTIGSDGSMGELVESMVERPGTDTGLVRLALEVAAGGIGSDGQMSRFLLTALEHQEAAMLGSLREQFRNAARTVGSDGSLGRVVRQMAVTDGSGGQLLGAALELAAAGIGSDGEMSVFLREVVERHPRAVAGEQRNAFLAAARTVGSDGSLGSVLEAMVRSGDSPAELVAVALEASSTLGSDGQMARFLVSVANRHPGLVRTGGALSGSFERALATVGSDGEENRVRRALERAGTVR